MFQFNQDLVEDLARRRAVLFLGTGVNSSSNTNLGKPIKQWRDFLECMAEAVADERLQKFVSQLVCEKDYLMACELIRQNFEKDKCDKNLTEEFAQIGSVSELHKAIFSLKQRITITTNFDKCLETAWQQFNPQLRTSNLVFSNCFGITQTI